MFASIYRKKSHIPTMSADGEENENKPFGASSSTMQAAWDEITLQSIDCGPRLFLCEWTEIARAPQYADDAVQGYCFWETDQYGTAEKPVADDDGDDHSTDNGGGTAVIDVAGTKSNWHRVDFVFSFTLGGFAAIDPRTGQKITTDDSDGLHETLAGLIFAQVPAALGETFGTDLEAKLAALSAREAELENDDD